MRIAALVLGVLLGIFVVGGLLLPGEIRVERSIRIDAPPEKVFPLVNDMEAFNRWSPWAMLDSSAKYDFSGPESGVGARVSWSSDDPDVGSGSQEIIRSRAPEEVVMTLDFGDEGGAQASFDLQPSDEGTQVTWRFGYDAGFDLSARYLGLLMERLVGVKYEEGLERLKRLAETGRV